MLHTSIVAMKNNLRDQIDYCSDEQLAETCEQIISAIRLTSGMWVECSYAYKAVELMDKINSRCTSLIESGVHHARAAKLRKVRNASTQLSQFMYRAHQKNMYACV